MTRDPEHLIRELKRNCPLCGGSGVLVKHTVTGVYLEDCGCLKKVSTYLQYYAAGIPQLFWDFGLDDVDAGFRRENVDSLRLVRAYIDDLSKNIKEGKGLWFYSAPGLGKSTTIAHIIKEALKRQFKVQWSKASKIVTMKFAALRDPAMAAKLEHIVEEVDILAIEEIDKVYLSDKDSMMNNSLYYDFLCDVYDTNKSILISSNKDPHDVLVHYPTFVQDRLRAVKPVIFRGNQSARRHRA